MTPPRQHRLQLDLELHRHTAVDPSPNVLAVATMFGLGVDERRAATIIPPTSLTLAPGRVVFITGPSGSGKSSLLNLIDQALADRPDVTVTRFDQLPPLPDRPLVDCFEPWCDQLQDVLKLLSVAGLNDAFVMLRKPSELSDGQRYRLKLAHALAPGSFPMGNRLSDSSGDSKLLPDRMDPGHPVPPHTPQSGGLKNVILADEFAATLDRTTAAVITANVRKWINPPRPRNIPRDRRPRNIKSPASSGDQPLGRKLSGKPAGKLPGPGLPGAGIPGQLPGAGGVCFIAATTHDDLLEPLCPDVLIEKHLGQRIDVVERG